MNKPYNRCLYCSRRLAEPSECDGPRTSAMSIDRWREYMRDVKEISGLTYEDIAERSNGQLSASSVQNVLAPSAKGDIQRETARLIENAIFGSSNAHPCPVDLLDAVPAERKRVMELEAELDKLRSNIARTHDSHDRELQIVREEAQRKIDHLKDQIEYLQEVNDRNSKVIDKLLEK